MSKEKRKLWYQENRERILLDAKSRAPQRSRNKKSWLVLNGHKPKVRFDKAKNNPHSRKKGWFLTFEQYAAIIANPCYYCGADISRAKGCGMDRLNNDLGYTLGNVVPCCYACNSGRNANFTPEEWKVAVQAILQFRKDKLPR